MRKASSSPERSLDVLRLNGFNTQTHAHGLQNCGQAFQLLITLGKQGAVNRLGVEVCMTSSKTWLRAGSITF